MYDGKVQVRKSLVQSLVMMGIEEERLLKLQYTSNHAQKFSYSSHYDEGTFPSGLLWHSRFRHLDYDNLHTLKKSGVIGLPTIPLKLKKCDSCILGNHNKYTFHLSHPKAHRKIECIQLIRSYLFGPMLVPYANRNKYMMTFIDDYTKMCWFYLLKNKSNVFKTFKNFHAWMENYAQSHIGSIRIDNGKEYTSNKFEKYLC